MLRSWILFVLIMLGAAVAHADDRTAAAQLAYEEADALMKAGRHAEACTKLEESLALEEAMGARYTLAECYEKIGKTASAWRNYVAVAEAAQKTGQTERAEYADKRAREIRARVATVTIVLAPAVRSLSPEVWHNGSALPAAMVGVAIPVDPGEHRFEVRAPGYQPFATSMTAGSAGEATTIDVPALTPGPSRGIPPLAIAGFVAGGVGVAGIVASIVIGVTAKGRYDDAVEANCPGSACNQTGVDETEDARDLGTAGTATFIAGSVLAGAGIAMVIIAFTTGSKEGRPALYFAPSLDEPGGMLVLESRF